MLDAWTCGEVSLCSLSGSTDGSPSRRRIVRRSARQTASVIRASLFRSDVTVSLQVFGVSGLGELVLAVVVPVLIVAFGSYVGVLMALQSFFGATSWSEAVGDDAE
jgi:hypothetical protein